MQNIEKEKKEVKNKFASAIKTNRRHCHVRGGMHFISNIEPSENTFSQLRRTIFDIAKKMPAWGEDYPIRWTNLERRIEQLRKEGSNVVTLQSIKKVAKEGLVAIITHEEMILFLNYQHQIGNVVFYNDTSLNECVIIKPTWLINAFKCIVFADDIPPFVTTHQKQILLEFKQTGVITLEVLTDLFKQKGPAFIDNLGYVLNVMMKFDIIVKDKLDNKKFICPCVIDKESSSFETILKESGNCFRSPWLCIEFSFLPPALYNHLLVFCMRDPNFDQPKLFYEIGLFCFKNTNGLKKFVLCLSKMTICVQVWSDTKDDKSCLQGNETIKIGQTLFKNISDKINDILQKYELRVEYKLRVLCCESAYDICETAHLYYLGNMQNSEYTMCGYHGEIHNFEAMFRFWIPVSTIQRKIVKLIVMTTLIFFLQKISIEIGRDLYHALN